MDELVLCQELSQECKFVYNGMQHVEDFIYVYYIYISSCLKSLTEKTKNLYTEQLPRSIKHFIYKKNIYKYLCVYIFTHISKYMYTK